MAFIIYLVSNKEDAPKLKFDFEICLIEIIHNLDAVLLIVQFILSCCVYVSCTIATTERFFSIYCHKEEIINSSVARYEMEIVKKPLFVFAND